MQLRTVVEPFGEVNVFPASNGRRRVRATILSEPHREGSQTGIAIDGSGSMKALYGTQGTSGVFGIGATSGEPNQVTPVAQKICAYLARKVDADGGTTCIYWATGDGRAIEVVGDLTAEQANEKVFNAPANFGGATYLRPAVEYFVNRFKDAPWGFYVFITDGALSDLADVQAYTRQLASEIAAKRRNPVKFVLIGVGANIDEKQMEALDDMDAAVDLWDHKIASEMRHLTDIFAEVVDQNARIAPTGRILDNSGQVVRDYSDTGVPALLEFEIAESATYFTLDVGTGRVHQPLADGASYPPAEQVAPGTTFAKAVAPADAAASAASAVTAADQGTGSSEPITDFDVSQQAAPTNASNVPL